MKLHTIKKLLLGLVVIGLAGCGSLDEVPFDRLAADTYYQDKTSILASLFRTYEHGHWYSHNDRFHLQEMSADHFVWTQKGRHGYDGGQWVRIHHHTWTPEDGWIRGGWEGGFQGVGYANNSIADFEKLKFEEFGLTEADKAQYITELKAIRAWYYIWLLDLYRNIPIVEKVGGDLPTQSTPQEVFNFIEKEIKDNVVHLPKGPKENYQGRFTQAGLMTLLARLYLNAEVWIGKPMYTECAKICEDIISGVYGNYSLANDWRDNFSYQNDKSPEAIWFMARQDTKLTYSFYYDAMMHYQSKWHWNFTRHGGWNGIHMTPSIDPQGVPYGDGSPSTNGKQFTKGLGSPFAKFSQYDLRKKNAKYLGNGKYEGMFAFGPQHDFGTDQSIKCLGSEEYSGQPLIFVDQVARFSEGKTKSDVTEGEENSGVRLVKFFWYPDTENSMIYNSDQPLIRLSEIYFMLAECKLRAGDKGGAASLVNQVIRRNYDPADWEDATKGLQYSAANFDMDAMLVEWGKEFLGECRRRTDLIRFNKFVGVSWWAYGNSYDGAANDAAETDNKKIIFPIPQAALNTNPNLKQNDY